MNGEHRACQTVPESDVQKAFSALLASREPGALYAKKRDPRCELEKSELCSVHGAVKEILHLHKASPAGVARLRRAREASSAKQEGVAGEGPGSEDQGEKEPLGAQEGSGTWNKEERIFRGFGAPTEWIRAHPEITLMLLALLVALAMGLVLAFPLQSAGSCAEAPVTPVTPVTRNTPLFLACPDGWVGYNGICYFLSKDHRTWEQGQARCSELGASLAVLKDREMEFLFPFSKEHDYWLGLHRRRQQLQWRDGSSFSSSVPVLGNAECVFLGEAKLRSAVCSNPMPYICSRAQTHL